MLNVKTCDVEAIQATFKQPKERLLHVIMAFLSQKEPTPTWGAIVEALRSPVVNLKALAMRIEAAHFPHTTSTRDGTPETTGMPKDIVEAFTISDNVIGCSYFK